MVNIRDFNATEIGEINSYVINQIPQSILPTLFIITEEPMKKAKIFNIIYRIMTAAKDFVEDPSLKKKLEYFLDKFSDNYKLFYNLYLSYEASMINKRKIERKIIKEFMDHEKNLNVNELINSFLVFAEKQELLETEKVTGINMDIPEGVELHKKLISGL